MTADPKVGSHGPSVPPSGTHFQVALQALQHIYQSSAYNYTKRQSETFIGTIMTGPGLAAALGKL